MTWWVAGAAVVGALVQSDSSRSAANKAADATKLADNAQERMFNKNVELQQPAIDQRNWALGQLRSALGQPITAESVMSQPGYQFGLDQGMKQQQAILNSRGMRASGAAIKAATQFGNDYATTKYGQAIDQRNALLSPLQSLANLGQSGATNLGAAGSNMANQIGSNALGLANVQGAAGIANANNWANAGNQLAGWYASQNRQQPQGQRVNSQYDWTGSAGYF